MPQISIVMPVYNTPEEYLREAIESILNQTFTDFEFLILNDGSTNNVQEVLESYDDKRIRIIQGEHKGLGYARHSLMNIAKGKYIAIMDSDDISLPERLEKQYSYLEANPEVSVLGSSIKCFPKEKLMSYPENPKFLEFLQHCAIANPTAIMRRADFEKYDLNYDTSLNVSEDYELWSRAVRYLKFHNLQEVLVHYRVNPDSTSRKSRIAPMQQDEIIRISMLNFLSSSPKFQNKIRQFICQPKFMRRIFSLSNQLHNNCNYKTLTLLGMNFRLYKKEK